MKFWPSAKTLQTAGWTRRSRRKRGGGKGELRLSRRLTERMAHASLRVSLEHGNGREEQKVCGVRPRVSSYVRLNRQKVPTICEKRFK